MYISIELKSTSKIKETTYKSYEVLVETKKINLRIASGSNNPNFDYVEVMVNNAAQRAYRSICGKQFKNISEALENYRDKKVLAAINAVKEYIYFSENQATAVN